MAEPIRILHMVGAMYPGGMENFIMNLYEKIDQEQFQFDFIVHLRRENDYRKQIEAMGGRVYEIPRLTKRPFASLKQLYAIVKKNRYPIVIRHTANALIVPQLIAAKMAGAKTICHSHNETDPKASLHRLAKKWIKQAADRRLACSKRAGEWMYGSLDFQVIHNAINVEKFAYSPDKAEKINREFSLQGKTVYGHIANFIESKNHQFLLSVFDEIRKKDSDAMFICLGDGDLRPEIEQEILRLDLRDRVILAGSRMDAFDFLSRFDLLIFPSLFEGLPLTLIEAQAAALPALISDTITPDVIITEGLVHRQALNTQPAVWADRAIALVEENKGRQRLCQLESIQKAGYDMNRLAGWYEEYFRSLIG